MTESASRQYPVDEGVTSVRASAIGNRRAFLHFEEGCELSGGKTYGRIVPLPGGGFMFRGADDRPLELRRTFLRENGVHMQERPHEIHADDTLEAGIRSDDQTVTWIALPKLTGFWVAKM